MIQRFEVNLLEVAFNFLSKQDLKSRKKILQDMKRAQFHIDPKLFKKLDGEIWELRTLYSGKQFRLFAFWDKTQTVNTLVFATHGMVKKTSKVPKKEIVKAERIRQAYFKNK